MSTTSMPDTPRDPFAALMASLAPLSNPTERLELLDKIAARSESSAAWKDFLARRRENIAELGSVALLQYAAGMALDSELCAAAETWHAEHGFEGPWLRRVGRPDLTELEPAHEESPVALAFDAQGRQLATLCPSGKLSVWDTESGELSFAQETGITKARTLAWHERLARFLLVASDHSLREYNYETRTQLVIVEGQTIAWGAVSPDGRFGVLGLQDESVELWDLGHWVQTLVFELGVRIATLASKARALVVSHEGDLRLLDASTGKELAATLLPDRWHASSALHFDGRRLALLQAEEGRLAVVDVISGDLEEHSSPALRAHRPTAVLCHGEDFSVATIGSDKTLRLWRPHTREPYATWHFEHAPSHLVQGPEGLLAVVAGTQHWMFR